MKLGKDYYIYQNEPINRFKGTLARGGIEHRVARERSLGKAGFQIPTARIEPDKQSVASAQRFYP